MQSTHMIIGLCGVVALGFAIASSRSASQPAKAKPTPLILEKNEGERRVFRPWPGHPDPDSAFVLKVDPKNGGSAHVVMGTEDFAPGETIPAHIHPGADEILFLQNGTAQVHLGGSVREVHGGATIFIPANTSISVSNTGSESIALVFVFSAPGFEEFMRATSVREGEKNTPLSKAEDDEIQRQHLHDVVYKEP